MYFISDNLKIVDLLIKNGAIVDLSNEYGWTALHFATLRGN